MVQVKGIIEIESDNFDFVGPKNYVLITQNLFSKLESNNQMLVVINVHIMATVQVGSDEMDWYGFLQLNTLFFFFDLIIVYTNIVNFNTIYFVNNK